MPAFASVAFSGTRAPPRSLSLLVSRLAASLVRSGLQLLVGCAQGVDTAVLAGVQAALNNGGAPGSLRVFAVQASAPPHGPLGSAVLAPGVSVAFGAGGPLFPFRAALVRRSAALVAALVSGPGPAALLAFPHQAAPRRLWPSAQPSECFCGGRSGTWATAALAAGRGASVFVHGPAGWLPQRWPGQWVASSQFAGFWQFVPAARQLPLV